MNQLTAQAEFQRLSKSQQEAHRKKIGVRVAAILLQFWQDNKTPEVMQVLVIEGWQDVLETCSHTEIKRSWATYQKEGPRTKAGRLYCPDAGALHLIIMRSRPKLKIVPTEEPECPPRATKEQAAEIMEKIGFRVNKFGGVH